MTLRPSRSYLSERVAKDKGVAIKLKTLKNGEATRQAVVDAFSDHLGKAKKGDVALFYYSGHGSQEQAPEEFWKLEPDHLDETLVLFDSRSPGSWDLADKEIAKLIGDVAAKGPHVAVILDCCHSGSGTREIGTVTRRAPTDFRRRPIESFLVSAAEAEAASASRSVTAKGSSRYAPPEGRHVLFAACRDDEEAKEYVGDGEHRGAFSFFLGESLRSAAGVPTYRDLFTRTSALLSGQVSNQSPQLEATQNDDLDATFLDGAIQPAPAAFSAPIKKDTGSSTAVRPAVSPRPPDPMPPGLPCTRSMPPPHFCATPPKPWRWPESRTSFPRPADSPSRTRSRSIRRRRTRPSSSVCRRLRCTCFWTVMPRAAPWSVRP